MTNLRNIFRVGAVLGCLAAPASAQLIGDDIELRLDAFLQATSPVADGAVGDGEYSSSMFLSFVDQQNPGNPYPPLNQMCGADGIDCNDDVEAEGDADLSATISWGYTADAFFIAFDVTDQFIDADEGVEPWNNDGVELVIDPDGDGEDERNWSLEAMKLSADLVNDGSAAGEIPQWVEASPTAGEWSSSSAETDAGYVIEFEVPLGSLDMEPSDPPTVDPLDAVPAATGQTMRMNFAINDIDIDGAGQGEGTHAMWWVFEDDERSPFGAAEGNWVVGMTLAEAPGPEGDFNANGELDAGDMDVLAQYMADGNLAGDVNGDGSVDATDRLAWTESIQNSWIGDSNFDGEFNSGDFVQVFAEGKYETEQTATYAEGDWDGNMRFDSGDFVIAFSAGGYEAGARPATSAVPEPSSGLTLLLAILICGRPRRASGK